MCQTLISSFTVDGHRSTVCAASRGINSHNLKRHGPVRGESGCSERKERFYAVTDIDAGVAR